MERMKERRHLPGQLAANTSTDTNKSDLVSTRALQMEKDKKTLKQDSVALTECYQLAPRDPVKIKRLKVTAHKSTNSGKQKHEVKQMLSLMGIGVGHSPAPDNRNDLGSVGKMSRHKRRYTAAQLKEEKEMDQHLADPLHGRHVRTCSISNSSSASNSIIKANDETQATSKEMLSPSVKTMNIDGCKQIKLKRTAQKTNVTESSTEHQSSVYKNITPSGRNARSYIKQSVTVIDKTLCLQHKEEAMSINSGKHMDAQDLHLNSNHPSGKTQVPNISTQCEGGACSTSQAEGAALVIVHANVKAATRSLVSYPKGHIPVVRLKYFKNRDIRSIQARLKRKGLQRLALQSPMSSLVQAQSESPQETITRNSPRLQQKEIENTDCQSGSDEVTT